MTKPRQEPFDSTASQEDAGLLCDPPNAEQGQYDEPDQHDRAEEAPDARRAKRLHQEQADQQSEGNRDHIGLEQRGRDFEPLDRTEHRNCRGYYSVAVKQRCADKARRHDPNIPSLVSPGGAQHQCGECQKAAFATVVGPHDHDDVFDRDDQRQGPDDQRQRAKDRLLAQIAEIDQRLAHRVER
jgi:hypothetical protein